MQWRRTWWLIVAIIAGITVILLPFASDLPDGLERVAETLGLASRERPILTPPLGNYSLPGRERFIGMLIATIIGTILVTALAYWLAWMVKRGGEGLSW